MIGSPVLHWIVDETHVDVNGVNVRNTILNPDWNIVQFSVVQGLHGVLGLLGRVVLHQAPVLQHAVLLRDLAVGRGDHLQQQFSTDSAQPACL